MTRLEEKIVFVSCLVIVGMPIVLKNFMVFFGVSGSAIPSWVQFLINLYGLSI